MKNKIITTIIILLLILLKIYLISVQPIRYIPENKYDDALMLKQANSILQGKMVRGIQFPNPCKRTNHANIYCNLK